MKKIISMLTVSLLLSSFFAIEVQASFPDLYDTDPNTEIIEYLQEEGVVDGYDDGYFRPLNLINRAEFMKMIVEGYIGETPNEDEYANCFPDVEDDWYAKYVCYGLDQGWINGYPDGSYRPGTNITRAEASKIIVNVFELEKTTDTTEFQDLDRSDWYWNYVVAAEEHSLYDKLDIYLTPHEQLSRRDFSKMLYRAIKTINEEEFDIWSLTESEETTYQDLLDSGMTAAFPSDLDFDPTSQSGWTYGCYAFSVKNLAAFKYSDILDMSEVQETIGWDGTFIWSHNEMNLFGENYDYELIMNYYGSPEYLLKKLATGEPVILYIPYYIGEDNIGHQLVAYSFDENGVWVADSLSGGTQRQIGWDEVFVDGNNYTTNITLLRKVKAGGIFRGQISR